MKKTLMIVLAISTLATVNVTFAKAEETTSSSSRAELLAQRKATVATLQAEREQWQAQRQEALDKIKAQREALKANKEKLTAERCAKIQERVQTRTANFEGKKEKHTAVYTNLIDRINKFITRFDEAKLDTAAIKSHLAELQVKIDKFKADYAAYATSIGATKTVACGSTEGEFKGALLESKTLLKAVHTDAADIRTYVRTVILADMKALKAQMPKEIETDND